MAVGPGARSFAAAGLAVLGIAAAAPAGEEEIRRELDRTREQVQQLLKRVEELEGKSPGPASPGDLGKAVEAYLAARPAAPGGCNVTAPGCRSIGFSGQVLVWWERWDGAYRVGDPAGLDVQDIGWLRAFLRADAEIDDGLRARIEVRDARAFGQEPSTATQLQAAGTGTDLKEGWFEADDLFGCGARTRAGRMALSYGDERVVGNLDWATYGRSFDGVLFSRVFERTKTKVDVFGARVTERGAGGFTPGVDNDDRDFFGIYTTTPKALHHSDLDVYAFWLRDLLAAAGEMPGTAGNTGFLTAGARVAGARDSLDWGMEGAVQGGSLAGDDLFAWAAHAHVGWTFLDAPWKPRVALEADVATGDDDPADGDRGSFQTLFPTNHKHYGILDLMAWQNMRAAGASLRLKPAGKWTIDFAAWRLQLDDEADAWYAASGAVLRTGAPGASRDLGTEFDAVVTWKASEHLRVALGGSQFLDGGFVRDTGGGGDAFWSYVRITVDF